MSHPPRLAAVWTRASARAAIEAVLARQPFEGRLTYFGVAKANDPNFAEQREAMFADGAHDEFIDVVNFLQHAPPSRAINTAISSYSWKHALQRHLRGFGGYGGYVSNGMFICGALHWGFRAQQCSPTSSNCFFNLSKKSVQSLSPYGQWQEAQILCAVGLETPDWTTPQ